MSRNKFSLLLLIISHTFPLYGLLYLGWSPYQTVLLFNIETLIMIFFFEVGILARFGTNSGLKILAITVFMLPTIILFNVIHLVLSTLMFGTTGYSLGWVEMHRLLITGLSLIIPGLILVAMRHIFDFAGFIQRKEYREEIPKNGPKGMQDIMIRIFFMQFTIIFGGFLAKASGHDSWGVSLIVVLQFVYSLILYRRSIHMRA